MRGKHFPCGGNDSETGITPADAGKTVRSKLQTLDKQDHPRGCGENQALTDNELDELGSPPRMRGKQTELVV